MLGGISGVSSYSTYYMNMNLYRNAARTQGALPRTQQAPEAPRTGGASGRSEEHTSELHTPY